MAYSKLVLRTCENRLLLQELLHGKLSVSPCTATTTRSAFSTSSTRYEGKSYPLLVVGGGTGGAATASKFARILGKGAVAVVEPHESHFYQPMWTLVGSGAKTLSQSARPMEWVLPKQADWIKDKAASFDPDNNTVTTAQGDVIKYENLVVALGIQLNYNQIKGLETALEEDPMVCSNYSQDYVEKTFPALQALDGGNAIFTFPNTPIKCPGAPQKIMYLVEDYLEKHGKRSKTDINYYTALGVLFGVKKYADALWKICEKRNIKVNLRHSLIEVDHVKREAVFENLDTKEKITVPYSFLHATPPMSCPDVLKDSKLVDDTGWVTVDKNTLQHTKYPNVFGIGDCTTVPTSKTAAACASQALALSKTLIGRLDGTKIHGSYDGYTSCPLITRHNKCIMAEFGFDGKILETFPIDQGRESTLMYHMKAHMLPELYFHGLVKGVWNGPKTLRKVLHLGLAN